MSLLEDLGREGSWKAFYEYKKEKQHLSRIDEQELLHFIEHKQYLRLTKRMINGEMPFKPPVKRMVNKMNSTKKRVVYTFPGEETWVLKLMSFLLYRYDDVMPENLYSFRKHYGVKRAVFKLKDTPGIDQMYCYKVDISDYFNSIDIDRLLPMLQEIMWEDPTLYHFMEQFLTDDVAVCDGKSVHEKRGIMAGCPIAPFLANLYLIQMDQRFTTGDILYARYSDDIICFAKTAELRDEYQRIICQLICDYGLRVNPSKEFLADPGAVWEFLGISYRGGVIDLSYATLEKMKGKIRRKARAIYRWRIRKNVPADTAMKTFIKIFNQKFFDDLRENDTNELTWSRWFFPIINTDQSLKKIDEYMQQYIRYIASGRHNKANYRTDYITLKKCGYRCLVNEYYKKSE